MAATRLIINTLRRLSAKKILRLLGLALPHPVFAVLSFVATIQAYVIAKKYFPESNSNNGIGNAFRHALWPCLILMYCCKVSSPKKAGVWCKKMTDMHEEIFPNEPLETRMDLHNNGVGMDYFFKMLPGVHRQFFEKSFFIEAFLEKTKSAVVLKDLDQKLGDELVYLA